MTTLLLGSLLLASGAQGDTSLDPRLVGSWHAEVQTTVLYGDVSVIVRTTYDFTIGADGSAIYHSEQTTNGGIGGNDVNRRKILAHVSGTVEQQGDTLIGTTSNGEVYRFRFRLSGNNGLWIDGRLFEKQ
jgi:hypothetical protein